MMKEKYQEWTYALFSAHLGHFVGDRSWWSHPNLYDLFIEFHKPKPWKTIPVVSNKIPHTLSQISPSILCLYHLGSHFENIMCLGEMGLSFDIILDRDVYIRNDDLFNSLKLRLEKEGGVYRFLFSDDPLVLLKARSALRQGRHLLVFADGNSGVNNVVKDQRVKVRFMNGYLKVKQGIAMISYILKTAIYPVLMRSETDLYRLDVLQPIVPDKIINREAYIKCSMQKLYDHLAEELFDRPYIWECWRYLHSNGSFYPPALSKNSQTDDNIASGKNMVGESWIMLDFKGNQVYFDRENYSVIR